MWWKIYYMKWVVKFKNAVISISHKLSAVIMVDKIFMFENREIIDREVIMSGWIHRSL